MKVCSRYFFVCPNKAAICMTCGGIKLRQIDDEGRPEDIMEGVSSRLETVFESVRNGVKSMHADCSELLPKISSAYRKMVALAVVPGNVEEPVQWQRTAPRSVNNNVVQLAKTAKKTAMTELVSVRETVDSDTSGSRRHQLPILLRNLLNEREEYSKPDVDEVGPESAQEARIQSYLTEVSASNLRSMSVAEIRHELSESQKWFENFGKNGLILTRPAVVSKDEQVTLNAA